MTYTCWVVISILGLSPSRSRLPSILRVFGLANYVLTTHTSNLMAYIACCNMTTAWASGGNGKASHCPSHIAVLISCHLSRLNQHPLSLANLHITQPDDSNTAEPHHVVRKAGLLDLHRQYGRPAVGLTSPSIWQLAIGHNQKACRLHSHELVQRRVVTWTRPT